MVIGSGQLASIFKNKNNDDCVIFASGVSNSNCKDVVQFNREKELLVNILKSNKNKKIIYFSSCALSVDNYFKNEYYNHKSNMESIIREYSSNYYIFRIPQLFGDLILHRTLINFIYKSIEHSHMFNVYDEAYRYVIEINDVKKLVEAYLQYSDSCITVDLANPFRYKVLDIVKILESLMGKQAKYNLIKKSDGYILDLEDMKSFINKHKIDISFSENYLIEKLKNKF